MNCEERKITHIIARKLDLRSVSRGKDPDRYMIIKRNRIYGRLFSCLSMNETQSICLNSDQKCEIKNFMLKFSIDQQHLEDYFALSNNQS